jgi:hypothetical protein
MVAVLRDVSRRFAEGRKLKRKLAAIAAAKYGSFALDEAARGSKTLQKILPEDVVLRCRRSTGCRRSSR